MHKKILPKEIINKPHQSGRINIYDESEIRRWAKDLGVSAAQIISAADTAGTGIEAIKNELRRRTFISM